MTRQEKEQAILAYCEEVCPNTSTGYTDLKDISLMRMHADRKEWQFTAFGCPRFFIHEGMPEADINSAYSYLGLETRALEEEIKRLRDGYTSARVRASNAFQEIEKQAFDRGYHYKSIDVWDADKVVKNDEFLGNIIDARKTFNAFVDAFIDPPTP